MERTILHCDMNNFYASVECMLDPALRSKPVVVGGDIEDRHGIVLAKNYQARAWGVTTGDTIWQARKKCSDLVVVPPHFEEYMKYSALARQVYGDYTDCVEPFGLDECWLDVSGSLSLLGNGEKIANDIRTRIKHELGLTVSCGVSYNKIFAKLGSDMKKPDAVTVISRENFRQTVWPLPARDLLGVGRATARLLDRLGIRTIGDLAATPPELLSYRLGKSGEMLIRYANGEDRSAVMRADYEPEIKSVGRGVTTREDLTDGEQVWNVILSLSQEVGHKLRVYEKDAGGVSIDVRMADLHHKQWQNKLSTPTHSPAVLARAAFALFERYYEWKQTVRAVTVRAIDLVPRDRPRQITLFDEVEDERRERLETAVECIRARYGKGAIRPATLCRDIKLPSHAGKDIVLPSGMLRE